MDAQQLLNQIMQGKEDAQVIEQLRKADLKAMESTLSTYLPKAQVQDIMKRVKELLDATRKR